jgi:hypothetical protein
LSLDLEQHINATVKAAIQNYLLSVDINQIVADTVSAEINRSVQALAAAVFNQQTQTRKITVEVDNWVQSQAATELTATAKNTMAHRVREMDIKALIEPLLERKLQELVTNYDFPRASIKLSAVDWQPASIPADSISGKFANFRSTGITDNARDLQFTVTDNGLVAATAIITPQLIVDDMITAKNLCVENTVEIQNKLILGEAAAATIENLAACVFSKQNVGDIDLTNRSIQAAGKTLLDSNSLGPSIINSNLRRVGNLTELTVMGDTLLSDTMIVTAGRVVINSTESAGVLTVWDEDAEFSLYKNKSREMFMGSSRNGSIAIGTNKQVFLRIAEDGTVEIPNRLRLSGRLISVESRIPERMGEPGELVIVDDVIYVCKSQNNWSKVW